MTDHWSQWGLSEPTADERDRLVLLGGGRGLVLGVSDGRSDREAALDDRFHVTRSTIKPGTVVPRRGDIVIWRGEDAKDPEQWWLWGAPTRVLEVEVHRDRIEVWTLEDADLTDLEPASIDDWFVEHDRELTEPELWSALRWWDLLPRCPRCGGETRSIVYGSLPGDLGPDVAIGGCVLGGEVNATRCQRCGLEGDSR